MASKPKGPPKPKWKLFTGGEEYGPYSTTEMERLALERRLTPESLIQHPTHTRGKIVHATKIPRFRKLIESRQSQVPNATAPPPPPPATTIAPAPQVPQTIIIQQQAPPQSSAGNGNGASIGGGVPHNHIPERVLGDKQLTRVRPVAAESKSINLYTVEIGSVRTIWLLGFLPIRKVKWHPIYEFNRGRWRIIAEQYAGAAALAEKFTWVDDYLEVTDALGNHLAVER